LTAVKFLLAAKLLGPEQFGFAGVALLILAIAESISDTGLSHAIIQNPKSPKPKERGVLFSIQAIRGLLLSSGIALFSYPLARFLGIESHVDLIFMVAALPLIRNLINPAIYLSQRKLRFKNIAIYEAFGSMIDFISSLIFIYLGFDARSLILGIIFAELAKLLISWSFFRSRIYISFNWSLAENYLKFGKWIWAGSFLTCIVNQIDKLAIAKFFGPTELGIYQLSSRIAQLFLADISIAIAQFSFPKISRIEQVKKNSGQKYLEQILKKYLLVSVTIGVLIFLFANQIIAIGFGSQWGEATPILKVMLVVMLLGGVVGIMASYLRAVGLPKIVMLGIGTQLIFLVLAGSFLTLSYGAFGMAIALVIALLAAMIYYYNQIFRAKKICG